MVYIEVKREAGHSGDALQEGMAYFLRDHATEEFMSSWQTLRPALLLTVSKVHIACCMTGCATKIMPCTMPDASRFVLPTTYCFGCKQELLRAASSPCYTMQVVGPSVRAFGMCVDATSTLVCEPICSAVDMLLIPHLPQCFATLANLFSAMPQLVRLLRFQEYVLQSCLLV